MNISHTRRCVFFHVPRTGGSSIKALGWWDQWTGHFPSAAEVAGRVPYFSFAFVRNPWERFVSTYHYLTTMEPSHPWYRFNARLVANILQFRDFGHFCREFPTWRYRHDIHFWPQCAWIAAADGTCLVDVIGRFERLSSDLAVMCRRLGVPNVKLPHLNGSRHGPYQQYYDDQTRAIVAVSARRDIEAFGFTFDGEGNRLGATGCLSGSAGRATAGGDNTG